MGSFTTITSAHILSVDGPTFMSQLVTSVNEREQDLGGAGSSFTAYPGARINDAFITFFAEFQVAAEGLLPFSAGATGFTKSDFTDYANFAAVLTAAGHSGGWLSAPAGADIISAGMESYIEQMRDVMLELVHYRRIITQASGIINPEEPSGSDGVRFGTHGSDIEIAWDNARTDTPSDYADSVAVAFYLTVLWLADLNSRIHGPVMTCPMPFMHGAMNKADLDVQIINTNPSDFQGGTPADFRITGRGSSSVTDDLDTDDTGFTTINYTSGHDPNVQPGDTFEIDLEILTSVPANSPWTGGGDAITLEFDEVRVEFDAEGDYTYG